MTEKTDITQTEGWIEPGKTHVAAKDGAWLLRQAFSLKSHDMWGFLPFFLFFASSLHITQSQISKVVNTLLTFADNVYNILPKQPCPWKRPAVGEMTRVL
ncbi:hypothetical protein SJ928_14010 [Enterococcus faecium]